MTAKNRPPRPGRAWGIGNEDIHTLSPIPPVVNSRHLCSVCGAYIGDDYEHYQLRPFRPCCRDCGTLADRARHDVHAWARWIIHRHDHRGGAR